MTAIVYNASLAVGVVLVGVGVGLWSIPAALVTVGSLVIGLAILGAVLSR